MRAKSQSEIVRLIGVWQRSGYGEWAWVGKCQGRIALGSETFEKGYPMFAHYGVIIYVCVSRADFPASYQIISKITPIPTVEL